MSSALKKKRRSTPRKLWDWVRAARRVLKLVSPRKRFIVIFGMFIASLLELLGLTMIIPLLATAAQLRQSKGMAIFFEEAFAAIGLPFDPNFLFVVIVFGLLAKAVVSVNVTRYVSNMVGDITTDYQLRLIRHLLCAQWSYFIRQPLGRLIHATGPEATAVGECFQRVTAIIANTLQTAVFLLLAAVISWEFLVFALVIGVSMLVSFGKLVQSSRRAARRYREQMRANAAKFTDAMIGIKQIRAMGRTDRFIRLFEADAQVLARTLRTRVFSSEYAAELQEPIIGLLIAGGFFFALYHLHLSLQEVVIMALLLIRTISAITPIQRDFQKFTQAYDQYQSLEALTKQTRNAAEVWPGRALPTLQRGIQFENVSFAYGEKKVLSELNMTIPCRGIAALAGPSGVGKSTTVDLLVGLHRPQAGRILIDGVDLSDIDLEQWRNMIGYVPQEVTLFHDSIFRNVSLWEDGVDEAQVEAALKAAGAWPFVEESPEGLARIVGERGHGLSGGQRQRISLARALLHRPRLLILDEATTGLDPETEAEICTRIRQLCEDEGLTVLAISHQPAWQEIADTVYLLAPARADDLRPEDVLPKVATAGA
jgi:ATP-binding cassette subfamily C protein